jgi:hypothetical protein
MVGPGPRIYIPQEQGGPVIHPGTGFPFHPLLRLAGLRGGIRLRLHPRLNYQLFWEPRYIASGRTQHKTPFPSNSSIVIGVYVAVA